MKFKDLDNSTQIILKVILAGLILWFLWLVRDIILLLIMALIIASAMEPLVDYLQQKKIPRVMSLLLVYLVVIGLGVLVVYLMIPPVIEQFKILNENLPQYSQSLQSKFGSLDIHGFIQGLFSSFNSGNVVQNTFGVFNSALNIIAVIIISIYLVAEEQGMKTFVSSLIPSIHHEFSLSLINKIQKKMGMWVLGQIIISFGIFIFTYIGLLLLHVKFALVLALVAGLFEIVPYIGPFISAIPAIFVAFVQNPSHPELVLWVIILYVLVHELEGYILVPKIMEKTVGTSPLLTLLALMVGYQLAGIVGLIVSVPLATALQVVVNEFWPGKAV